MLVNTRAIHMLVSFITIMCSFYQNLYADLEVLKKLGPGNLAQQQTLESYLLPAHHPLQAYLRIIFKNPKMFKSADYFKKEDFKVKFGHRKLMVGFHPSIPDYLFKKFPDSYSQKKQLENFIKRIEGAKVLRNYIKEHNFKHLVVPEKWLYKLPKSFSVNLDAPSYILIVENMDIYEDGNDPNGMAARLYYYMDREMLTELCMTLHAVGGCDAYPRNQPFTRSGKIAFVDTEHVGQMKGHFIKHIIPALNPELQAYALALWMKLEEEEQTRCLRYPNLEVDFQQNVEADWREI